jgi:protoporphyrinogen oxidase
MKSIERPKVVILGAGPAGVGAAYRLMQHNRFDVTILERNEVVGGNAGSFTVGGLKVDYGSHRLHPSCDPRVFTDIQALLGDDLLERPRHGRIHLKGRWIHFPLKPVDLMTRVSPAFAFGVGLDVFKKMKGSGRDTQTKESFATVLEAGLGRTICRDFYFPYARKLWGVEPDALSGTQAKRRVQAGSLSKMFRKILGMRPDGRQGQQGVFYYPRGGFGQITESYSKAAEAAGATILLETSVRSLQVAGTRVHTVVAERGGKEMSIPCDHVWSTIPLTALVRSLHPSAPPHVLESAGGLTFRSMVLVYLVLKQDRFTEFDAHYFPDTSIPISRLSEPKNYSLRGRSGTTVLCAEMPCSLQDPVWSMPPDELGQVVVDALARLSLPVTGPVMEVLVKKLSHAYPVYLQGYEARFKMMDEYLEPMSNLLTFGRQGLFAHDNTHHALFMAYAAADCLSPDGAFAWDRWKQYRAVFETHVVED